MRIGEAGVASGCAEEKDVLLGGTDEAAQSFRKQLAEPRAAGKDIVIGFESRAVGERQASQTSAFEALRCDRELPVFSPFGDKCIYHRLATGAGIEVSALRFVNSPVDAGEVDLWPAFSHLGWGEFLKLDLGLAKHCERAPLEGVVAAAHHPENTGTM